MAYPLDTHAPKSFANLDEVLSLVRFPNVFVMVSSAPCFSNEPYPFRDLHPYLRRIYDVYGPRRMLWGADLSRLRGTYRECLDLFRYELDFLPESDKEWILGRALAEALNWPETAA
jgi:predicted TIM-barrel fold metal-dependent hydrolase